MCGSHSRLEIQDSGQALHFCWVNHLQPKHFQVHAACEAEATEPDLPTEFHRANKPLFFLMNYFITSLSTSFSLHFTATEQFNPCFPPAETLVFRLFHSAFIGFRSLCRSPRVQYLQPDLVSGLGREPQPQAVKPWAAVLVPMSFCWGFLASCSASWCSTIESVTGEGGEHWHQIGLLAQLLIEKGECL